MMRMERAFVVLEREGSLVIGVADFDFALVLEQAIQFIDGLGGNDEFALALFGNVRFLVHQRQPAAVGGDHGHFVVFEADENAVEDVAGFIGGNGKRGFLHHSFDFFLGQDDFLVLLELGHGRKFIGRQAVDFVKGSAGTDAANIFLVHLDLNFRIGQFADDAEKFFHRHGGGAGLSSRWPPPRRKWSHPSRWR